MGIKQLYNDNLRKLQNEYGDVSVMLISSLTNTIISQMWQLPLHFQAAPNIFIDETGQA